MSIAPRRDSLSTILATLAATPSFGIRNQLVPASAMAWNPGSGLTTFVLSDASSNVAKLQSFKSLVKGGAAVMRRVTGTPSAVGEFAITGSTLSIKGNVTGSGDTYSVTYPTS